jgi:hypothetical protein
MFDSIVKVTLGLILIVIVIAIGPLAIMWSIMEWYNVLVKGSDPWTFSVWFATVILATALRANVTVKRKD